MPWPKAFVRSIRLSAACAACALATLAWLKESGKAFSGYDSLMPDSRLEIAGRTVSAEIAARSYLPIILPDSQERPRSCLYEIRLPDRATLEIIYRFLWPDERHPRSWADGPYRLWRKLYFGSTQDIESVRVEVDRISGKARRIFFESPEVGPIMVRHVPRSLDPAAIPKKGSRVYLRVASWNHLFEPAATADPAADSVPLEFLRPELYRNLRVSRISSPGAKPRVL